MRVSCPLEGAEAVELETCWKKKKIKIGQAYERISPREASNLRDGGGPIHWLGLRAATSPLTLATKGPNASSFSRLSSTSPRLTLRATERAPPPAAAEEAEAAEEEEAGRRPRAEAVGAEKRDTSTAPEHWGGEGETGNM